MRYEMTQPPCHRTLAIYNPVRSIMHGQMAHIACNDGIHAYSALLFSLRESETEKKIPTTERREKKRENLLYVDDSGGFFFLRARQILRQILASKWCACARA